MSIDEKLFDFRIGNGMRRHGTISSFVWVVRFIKTFSFGIGLQLFNNSIGVFRIIFSNKSFNAGRIKDGHIGFFGVYSLTNRFRKTNKVIKYDLKVIDKILFEACDFGSIRNLDKATEFTKRL